MACYTFGYLFHLFMNVSVWQHFINAPWLNNNNKHVSQTAAQLPPHPQPVSALATSPPAHHWAWDFLESAHEITPLSWHHGAIHNTTRGQPANTKSAHVQFGAQIIQKLHLCTHYFRSSSAQLMQSILSGKHERVCVCVWGCQSAVQSSGNEALCRATQLLSACQSCQVCCLSKARELFFFHFLPWPVHLRVSLPPSDVAL